VDVCELPQLGYLLSGLGILGVVISLVIQQSDYDPISLAIGAVSIIVAIVGISLVLKPNRKEASK
jgi:uncharacterized membrane protein YbaN (DUF454 family)